MKAIDADRHGYIIRLYNSNREHKLSLLPCGLDLNGDVEVWDLATPDGKVQYCGVDNDLMDSLAQFLGWEDLKPQIPAQCSRCGKIIEDGHYDCAFV